jgi:hypothetical protein
MLADLPVKVGHVSFLGPLYHTQIRAVASRHSQLSGFERVSQTLERACSGSYQNFPCTFRLDPSAAFPDTRSRSLNKQKDIQKRARLQPRRIAFTC